jgi:hypothetical protein
MCLICPSDSEESILPMPYTRVALGQLAKQAKIEMRIDLSVMGMESLAVQPVGKDLKMTVAANWPHASFFGGQLPEKKHHVQRLYCGVAKHLSDQSKHPAFDPLYQL